MTDTAHEPEMDPVDGQLDSEDVEAEAKDRAARSGNEPGASSDGDSGPKGARTNPPSSEPDDA